VLENPAYSLEIAPNDFSVPEDEGNVVRKAF
jgi:hypothetical protein